MKVFIWAENVTDTISGVKAIAVAKSREEAEDYLRKYASQVPTVDMSFLDNGNEDEVQFQEMDLPNHPLVLVKEPGEVAMWGEDVLTFL